MKNILNAKWLWLVNTLPLICLMLLHYNNYEVANSQLSPEQKTLWLIAALGLASIWLMNVLYASWLAVAKQTVSVLFSLLNIITCVIFCLFAMEAEQSMTGGFPTWMLTEKISVHVGTFMMPSILYGLLCLLVWFQSSEASAYKSAYVLSFIAVPLLVMLAFILGNSFISRPESTVAERVIYYLSSFIAAAAILSFTFGLLLIAYNFLNKRQDRLVSLDYRRNVYIGFVAIILPPCGLWLNMTLDNLFGNFENKWFYILAVTNGLLLMIPNNENLLLRLLLFAFRSAFLPFILYFTVIFLPILPLGVLAILALGLGLLTFLPLLIFVTQIRILYEDLLFLVKNFNKGASVLFFIGILVLPALLTVVYMNDRVVLHNAMNYAYSSDYDAQCEVNSDNLGRTLRMVEASKERPNVNFFWNTRTTPFIDRFYQWLVLDNLTLSDEKAKHLAQIFLGVENDLSQKMIWSRRTPPPRLANPLMNYRVESAYDAPTKTWTSWVHLDITNADSTGQFGQKEYFTQIQLPAACWVQDYYLMVGKRRENGILAEKKAALWIYNQIVSVNRDPGLLYYSGHQRLNFHIFPFADKETRQTGIQFLHKEPLTIHIDSLDIQLGKQVGQATDEQLVEESPNACFVRGSQKSKLSKIKRKPYYHFLVDCSVAAKTYQQESIALIQAFLDKHKIKEQEATLSLVNAQIKTMPLQDFKSNLPKEAKYSGGFYADRALKGLLAKHYVKLEASCPIFVLVTPQRANAILSTTYDDFTFALFEHKKLYQLGAAGSLNSCELLAMEELSFSADTLLPHTSTQTTDSLYVWPNLQQPKAFFRNNAESEIFYKISPENRFEANATTDYRTGLALEAQAIQHLCFPSKATTDWVDLVRKSFRTKLLCSATTYIALEDEAQKVVLNRKQKQVLSGNKNLDLGEETQQAMSEPGDWLLLLVLVLFLCYLRIK